MTPFLTEKYVYLSKEENALVYIIHDWAQNDLVDLSMEHKEAYKNAYLRWKTERRDLLNEKIAQTFQTFNEKEKAILNKESKRKTNKSNNQARQQNKPAHVSQDRASVVVDNPSYLLNLPA